MIDFKGYKYAVVTIQGGVYGYTNNEEDAKRWVNGVVEDAFKYIKNPDYKEEKQMDNIYTQEMYDAGELPKVGMTFFDSTKNYNQTVLAVTRFYDRDILTIHNDKFIVDAINFCTRYIKPIDTRTDKEKAIDDLVSELTITNFDANMNDMDLTSIVNVAFEAGVTFTENKND